MRSRSVIRLSIPALALAAACLAGCSSHDEGRGTVYVSTGALVVDWTVEEATDPNLCTATSSSVLVIDVTNGGQPAGTFQQTCGAFATTITLAPGEYAASAYLTDAAGTVRTTTVPIAPFAIYSATSLDIPIDFPANAFY